MVVQYNILFQRSYLYTSKACCTFGLVAVKSWLCIFHKCAGSNSVYTNVSIHIKAARQCRNNINFMHQKRFSCEILGKTFSKRTFHKILLPLDCTQNTKNLNSDDVIWLFFFSASKWLISPLVTLYKTHNYLLIMLIIYLLWSADNSLVDDYTFCNSAQQLPA